MSRTAAFAVLWTLALFGGGESNLILLAPLSLGKQAHTVIGWEAGRIPEPALEHIPAAVSLIIYSSHYSPLGSHEDSISSVRPCDQIDEHEKRTVHFLLYRYENTICVLGFRCQRLHFPHKSTVINGHI